MEPCAEFNSAQRHVQHQPVEAGVGDQQIAAAAQHEQRHAALARPSRCLRNLVFAGGLGQTTAPARRCQRW